MGFVPIVGDAIDIAGAVVGRDLMTGESIGKIGVGVTIAGTLFGSGKLARETADALLPIGKKALKKMDLDPQGHGFPRLLEADIFSGGPALSRADGRAEFLARGTNGDNNGVYHITVKNGEITHRAFINESDWKRYSGKHGLPTP